MEAAVVIPNPLNGGSARLWVVDTWSPRVEREEECASGWLGDAEGGSTGDALQLLLRLRMAIKEGSGGGQAPVRGA
jgi:hypothetical protein